MLDDLPPSIRIGPFDVALEAKDKLSEADEWGDFEVVTIRLKSAQPSPTFAVDTLLHEIYHAIYKWHSLRKHDDEERICSVMATGLTQVLRDNPKLLAWILKSLT